jgi:integrase
MFDLAAAKGGSQSVWLRLAMATGARRGEVLALRWCDIDLERGSISITGSMSKKGRGTTKNRQSVRLVAIDADTLTLLRQWRRMSAERSLTLGVHVGDDWHVVSDNPETGQAVLLNTATHRLNRLANDAGCPGARLHDLRHAHATMLLEAGVSTRTVADRLGHSRVSTTTDIYGHVLNNADEAAAATFGGLLHAEQR